MPDDLQGFTEQVDVVMSPVEWQVFCKALDGPPRSIPALKELFAQASVFDDQAESGDQ